MQTTQLIDVLKKPVLEVVKDKKIAPSILISEAIYILDSDTNRDIMDDLITNNNPFAIKAGKKYNGKAYRKNTIKYKTFETMELGIYAYINAHTRKFNDIANIYNYENALLLDKTLSDAKKEQIETIIKGYSLDEVDKEIMDNIYEADKNVIEISKDNETTSFYQKMHDCEPEREKVTPEVIIKRESEKKEKEEKKKTERGSEIILRNANLYQNARSSMPTRNISGTYYVSTKVINNRLGIVMKKEYCGNDSYIMGYINICDIK